MDSGNLLRVSAFCWRTIRCVLSFFRSLCSAQGRKSCLWPFHTLALLDRRNLFLHLSPRPPVRPLAFHICRSVFDVLFLLPFVSYLSKSPERACLDSTLSGHLWEVRRRSFPEMDCRGSSRFNSAVSSRSSAVCSDWHIYRRSVGRTYC